VLKLLYTIFVSSRFHRCENPRVKVRVSVNQCADLFGPWVVGIDQGLRSFAQRTHGRQ
jgi:hypothetical protein